MINYELYKRSTNILFDAYFNDTLEHSNCHACAVGNLIAANTCNRLVDCESTEIKKKWFESAPLWQTVFITYEEGEGQIVAAHNYNDAAKEQIDATGYTWQELAKIEYAFEKAPRGKSDEDYMYNGLVAVLEVLKEIHEIKDDSEVERFTSHYKTKQNTPVKFEDTEVQNFLKNKISAGSNPDTVVNRIIEQFPGIEKKGLWDKVRNEIDYEWEKQF